MDRNEIIEQVLAIFQVFATKLLSGSHYELGVELQQVIDEIEASGDPPEDEDSET